MDAMPAALTAPFLSVVIPVYNRESTIVRCLKSVLRQVFTDYEIIVVDDGSTDRSVQVLQQFTVNPAFRLLEHGMNRGVLAARKTGWDAARGRWVISLDSDDELVPSGLSLIAARLERIPAEISSAQFQVMRDGWQISPDPPFYKPCVIDYEGYLESLEHHYGGRFDTLHCFRAAVVPHLHPISTGLEDLFCLDFHKEWTSVIYPEVALLYHQDAGNQLSRAVEASPHHNLGLTWAQIAHLEVLLVAHGRALRRLAPRWFHRYASQLGVLHFAVGNRRLGMRYSLRALRVCPTYPRSWVVPALGLFGARAVVWGRGLLGRWRRATALGM